MCYNIKNTRAKAREGGENMLDRAYVEITNICNLKCAFCPGTKRAPRTMTLSEVEAVFEKLCGII